MTQSYIPAETREWLDYLINNSEYAYLQGAARARKLDELSDDLHSLIYQKILQSMDEATRQEFRRLMSTSSTPKGEISTFLQTRVPGYEALVRYTPKTFWNKHIL